MRYLVLLTVMLSSATVVYSNSEDHALQQEVISRFYTTTLGFKQPGVPSPPEIDKLRPYISTALNRLLREARAAEAEYQRKIRGKSPPLIESYVFYSLFEGAHSI